MLLEFEFLEKLADTVDKWGTQTYVCTHVSWDVKVRLVGYKGSNVSWVVEIHLIFCWLRICLFSCYQLRVCFLLLVACPSPLLLRVYWAPTKWCLKIDVEEQVRR